MKIPLGGLDAEMTQQIFDVPDINSFFKQMRGEAVPQGMNTNRFIYHSPIPGGLKYLLGASNAERLTLAGRIFKQIGFRKNNFH